MSDSRHSYDTINTTINQLMGTGHVGTDFIVHSTTMDSFFSPNAINALDITTQRYDQNGVLVSSAGPYQIYTTSATGYTGDNTSSYDLSATNDLAYNYALTASTNSPPPAFHIAPGGDGWTSASGVEWTLDPVIFCSANLSCLTAANAGMISVLRFLHSTSTSPWNWFDTKAALRQTGTNWATGYDKTTYGFGQVNYATANALTDGQILLQPPIVATTTTGISNQITFTVYPFKQTRRVKEVLFQFSSAPAFNAGELTLSAIQAIGGTKITEYTGTTATTTAPLFTAITNKYFVWFTTDNATDSLANFSRIDTYSVLGPVSQNQINFSSTFDIATPLTNAVSATQSPTFIWGAASSYFGISKYQLFVDGVLNKDNIAGTSATPTGNLSEGTHTWYIKAFNTGGAATTTISTPTININTNYASGYTFYVDNVLGSDNNPGSQALPWATVAKAGLTAGAGDTVIIIKNVGVPYRETLSVSNSGTAGLPITFRGVDVNNKPEIWGSVDVSSGWSVYSGGGANTYQHTFATSTTVVAVGASLATLTKKTQGSAATTLSPGQWFWASNVLYYRLAAGESISSLQIEAASHDYDISSSSGVNYTAFQNLIVRYANLDGVILSGTNQIAQGIEAYDSHQGIWVEGTNNLLKYSIAARNTTDGIYVLYPLNGTVYNSLMYGNGTNGGTFSAYTGVSIIFKNNVSSGNSVLSFGSDFLWNAPTFSTSHNLWDIAGDSNWDIYKGTNNQELIDPLLIAPASSNFALKPLSPAIDTGTAITGLTTDILGNPIYGTPDLGPYEYQPPYTIGTHDINITGSIRLYKNGKYRYTNATTTGTTANMNITPVGGFPAGDYSEFLNVNISTWNKTGDYAKTWTETSTTATSTLHTIGNLRTNTSYTISVDGAAYTSMITNASGQGTFTYAGGYSTHTFNVTEAPAAFALIAPVGTTNADTKTFSWQASSDASGLAKYQFYLDGTLKEDNIVTTTTQTSASGFSCGDHPWYIRAINNIGNRTDSDTQTFSVACGGGPIIPAGTILPNTPTPRLQTITNGIVTYLDETATTTEKVSPPVAKEKHTTTPPQVFTRTLKRGSKGRDVTLLQELLKKDPVLYPEGSVTGFFGLATERALKRFQEKHDIVSFGTPTSTGYGVVGPRTRGRLQEISLVN